MLYLNRISACVVGSAYTLKNSNLGDDIDSHDIVIRPNAHTKYPKDVGSKFTILCTPLYAHHNQRWCQNLECHSQAQDIQELWLYLAYHRMVSQSMPKDAIKIWLENIDVDNDRIGALLRFNAPIFTFFGIAPWCMHLKNAWHCEENSIEYYRQQPYLTNRILSKRATTGVMAIITAIYRGWNVSVAGFGKRDVTNVRAYDHSGPVSRGHDYDQERLFLNELETKKLIKRLDG